MDVLDRETLLTLAQHKGWPSISIYMPTHPIPTESEPDPIVLKNLLKSAEEDLAASDMRAAEIDSMLKPARDLLSDGTVWRSGGAGLAVFIAEDTFYSFRSDGPFPERCSVSDRFLIRPLLAALGKGGRFFVLALSQKRVRLLEGSPDDVREIDLSGVPESLAEALKYDDYERQVQFHSRTPAGASGKGRRPAIFHGHGGAPEVGKDNVARYLRMVAKGIHEFLRDDNAPLVLAGVEFLIPMYREANTYPHLVGDAVLGNPDELTAAELHAKASELLEPHFRAELEADREDFARLGGTGSVSTDLDEIVPAASEGRVKTLFVSDTASAWGQFDPSSGRVDVHDSARPGDWDLTDFAAAETLLHGGVVHVEAEEDGAAAIFRY